MATDSELAAFLKSVLDSPGERQDIDYKSALSFEPGTDFSLSSARHIQGMANVGGGWLALGYVETDEGLVPDPDHSNAITASYEATRFSQYVNKFVVRGQQNREFYTSTMDRLVMRGRVCNESSTEWHREVTQDYVTTQLKPLVEDVANGLFVLFDFMKIETSVVGELVDGFLNSRLARGWSLPQPI